MVIYVACLDFLMHWPCSHSPSPSPPIPLPLHTCREPIRHSSLMQQFPHSHPRLRCPPPPLPPAWLAQSVPPTQATPGSLECTTNQLPGTGTTSPTDWKCAEISFEEPAFGHLKSAGLLIPVSCSYTGVSFDVLACMTERQKGSVQLSTHKQMAYRSVHTQYLL